MCFQPSVSSELPEELLTSSSSIKGFHPHPPPILSNCTPHHSQSILTSSHVCSLVKAENLTLPIFQYLKKNQPKKIRKIKPNNQLNPTKLSSSSKQVFLEELSFTDTTSEKEDIHMQCWCCAKLVIPSPFPLLVDSRHFTYSLPHMLWM